jgi:hypothetical protein
LLALAACKDPAVPNYQSPTIDPTTQSAIQQQVTGIFSGTRGSTATGTDLFYYIQAMSSFGRDAGNFTNTDSRYLTEWLGNGVAIPNSDFYGTVVWDNEFRVAKSADLILTNLPSVSPAYSASDANLITGVVQTWKAYNFMLIAETRDTNGVPVAGITQSATQAAPILCNKDVWAYIVAVLDSAETALVAGSPKSGTGPLPVSLPPGFNGASLAGPSTTPGTFAGFNRALRAKAGLEYAYAIARSSAASAPAPSSPGVPDAAALNAADAAAKASFIFNNGTVEYVQLTATNYIDPFGVYHSFSGASGDQANPVFSGLTYMFVLNEAQTAILSDPRAGKLITNPSSPGQPSMNAVVCGAAGGSPCLAGPTIGTYPSASSPIPIVRNEDMVLLDAAIQLGLGNTAQAVTLINAVRTAAGAASVNPAGYPNVRDQLLLEFRASNMLESGEYRTILIRDYGLIDQSTTTWGKADLHTTVEPIPIGDVSARNGNLSLTCN